MITPSRKRIIFWSALAFSVVLVAVDWIATDPFNQWWRELGVQLPGITISWLETTWHVVAAIVLIGSAGLIRLPRFFVLGITLWIVTHVLYLALVGMALYLPFVKTGSLHEFSADGLRLKPLTRPSPLQGRSP